MVRIILLQLIVMSLFFKAHNLSRDDFPSDFVFGSGSSAYQVEGAANEDGRTPSIWDTFAHAGHVRGNGDIACDQYHKYKEDVQLMVETGLEAYRFSISWSRLIPNGRGPINPKGLQYYNNLINELINNGIQPHVTLFHSDTPQALEDEYGGWLSRKAVDDFTAYADVCFKEFGDRVVYWTTLNEPNAFAIGGYDYGFLQPGRCSAPFGKVNCSRGNSTVEPYLIVHHMLLAHASAARLYKKKYQRKQQGFIGLNVVVFGFRPVSNIIEDEVATQRANVFYIGWLLNPLVYGDYPVIMKRNADSRIPTLTDLESESLKGSFDFIGLNYYFSFNIKDKPISLKLKNRDFTEDMAASMIEIVKNDSFASGKYPIVPWGLLAALNYIKNNYDNPLVFIHENGQLTSYNSSLEDFSRVNYLQAHIGFLHEGLRNGINIGGYFQWSFLDLFELFGGYDNSFGLYYIDLDDPDLKRQPKLSAKWYSSFLKKKNNTSNGIIKSHSLDYLSY